LIFDAVGLAEAVLRLNLCRFIVDLRFSKFNASRKIIQRRPLSFRRRITRLILRVMDTSCVVCEEVCPVSPKAIITPNHEATNGWGETIELKQAYIDPVKRIGCGICEHECPVQSRTTRPCSSPPSAKPAARTARYFSACSTAKGRT
jgi:ferredoxin